MESLAFYTNFHNDSERLVRCLAALRKQYASAALFVYDDHSRSDEATRLHEIAQQDRKTIVLDRQAERAHWASYNLVTYELEHFDAIRSRGYQWVFKMDTDTVICSGRHEDVLALGGDIVGNVQWLDPATAVRSFFPDRDLVECTVYGGGYFVRLSELVGSMRALWRGVPESYRNRAGTCQEDQSIAALCWLAGGKVTDHPRLHGVRFDEVLDHVDSTFYAVHPVKTHEVYHRLFGPWY